MAPDRDFFDHDNNPATPPIARIAAYATRRGNQPISELTTTTPITANDPNAEQGARTALSYVNFGRVQTYGFDASVSYAFTRQISGLVNYSYFGYNLDQDDLANDGNKDGRVDVNDLPINTPANKLGVGLNYTGSRLFGGLFGRWVQAYDFFSGINVAAATNESLIYAGSPVVQGRRVGTSFNYGPLGGFFNLDVSLGYKFGKYLTLSGQVVNVLNAEVREFIGSPAIAPLYSVEVKVDLPAFATKR